MKKLLALLLALFMLTSLITACDSDYSYDDDDEDYEDYDEDDKDEDEDEEPEGIVFEDGKFVNYGDEELAYVLIYNPEMYDSSKKLVTGDFGLQVEPFINRDGELDAPQSEDTVHRYIIDNTFPISEADLDGNRAPVMLQPYYEGDTHNFYTFQPTSQNPLASRKMKTFTCEYAGEYCYIWVANDVYVSSDRCELLGEEFDENIYLPTVEMFGNSRFANTGSKVNILLTDLGQTGTLGVAAGADVAATGEYSAYQTQLYGINYDHTIINVNANYIIVPEYHEDYDYIMNLMLSTLGHEFQHQIAFSDAYSTLNGYCYPTWLNEAMSGYIEEQLYTGSQTDATSELSDSDLIRHGQSLYNFATNANPFDIGVYGSVYLFSEYLANLAGDDVFSNIHNYWRTSYSQTLCDSEAIANSVPSKVKKSIDKTIDYEGNIDFASKDDEWLSKLALDFYISQLEYDKDDDPEAFERLEASTLLYDEINQANIEGGGRVIVELSDGEFEVPSDADDGLIYIGLNEDFEVVTDYIYY
ncbi:MAG: hypothetical protein IJC81_01315 [Clostridia bacterium]|nr:hypothetical protein [Clostridia bacterium]